MRNAIYGVDGKTQLSRVKGPLAAFLILLFATTLVASVMAANTFYVWVWTDGADGSWSMSTGDPGTNCYNKLRIYATYGPPDSDFPQSSGSPYMYRLMARCTGGPGTGRMKGAGLSSGYHPDGYLRYLAEGFWPVGSDTQIRSYAMLKVPSSGAGIFFGPTEWISNPGFNGGSLGYWTQHKTGSGVIAAELRTQGSDGTTTVYSQSLKTLANDADQAWMRQYFAFHAESYKAASFLIYVVNYGTGGGEKWSIQQSNLDQWGENYGIALLFNNQGVYAKACSNDWTRIFNALSTGSWHQFSIWQSGTQVFIIDNTTGSTATLTFGGNCSTGPAWESIYFGDPGVGNCGTFYWDNTVAMNS